MRQRLLPCSGMYTPVKPWSGPAQTGCSNSLMIMSKRHKNTPGKCKPAGGKIMPKNRFLILLWVKWWVKRNFYKPKTRISYADTRVFVGGVREIWTLAALSDPTPLAGAPLRPLEYYSTSQSDKLFTFSHKMAERCPSGLRNWSWKPAIRASGPWVRIPSSPPFCVKKWIVYHFDLWSNTQEVEEAPLLRA